MPLWSAPMAGALLFLCYSAFSCSASPSGHSCCKKGAARTRVTRARKSWSRVGGGGKAERLCGATQAFRSERHSRLFPRFADPLGCRLSYCASR